MGELEGQRWRCANCGADFVPVVNTTAATARACLRCFGELARARRELLAVLELFRADRMRRRMAERLERLRGLTVAELERERLAHLEARERRRRLRGLLALLELTSGRVALLRVLELRRLTLELGEADGGTWCAFELAGDNGSHRRGGA